jgi:FtsZ-interacting cell division protein ZipA
MLIAILSAIFLVTFYIHSRQKRKIKMMTYKQEPRFDGSFRNSTTTHEVYEEEYEELGDEQDEHHHEEDILIHDPLLQPRETPKTQPSVSQEKKTKSAPEETIYIMLAAKQGKPYAGYELLQSLLSAGLRFGAMDLFHRYEDLNGKGKILFSVASASESGTFEINKMGAYVGKGLMMFLRLSSHRDLLFSFDAMIETAKQLVEDLDGDILDDERKVLTSDKIEIMRKKVVEFEQRQVTGDLFDEQ